MIKTRRNSKSTARGRAGNARIARLYLSTAQETFQRYLPRIVRCLGELTEDQIWWRPNAASNSAGNLVLHLCGNIRQWIISGLGGAPDVRRRDAEFAERGPLARRILALRLKETVNEAVHVLRRLPPETLLQVHTIQGFRVTGLYAVFNVTEHFSHHAGQIFYIAKMKGARNLHFTKLPPASKRVDYM